MGAFKREPTPSGPITDLFDRLHEIHLEAGQPSIRQIAARIGHGVISSSTIHNMFRGPRVPKWGFLELVVEELRGDTAEFQQLWQAARRVEEAAGRGNNLVWTSLPGNSKSAAALLDRDTPASSPAPANRAEPSVPGPIQRIWSTEIPRRNPHFAGRIAQLKALRDNLIRSNQPHPPTQLISGIGGVGKTEIATEYIHRHRDKYEIIWWIRAEHTDRVRDALVKLGQRLEVRPAGTEGGRDRTIAAVLDALASGVRPNWLLVYDNAAQPLELQSYLPASLPGGHIIITSRQQNWPVDIEKDIVGISPFTDAEAIDFLRRRVPILGVNRMLKADEDKWRTSEAARLAEALGHLPIAVEHAAAYLTETGQTVDDYLSRFWENARRMLSEQHQDYPASVSATWAMSTALLTPDAGHLLNLCAFFSPEPIAVELFLDHARAVIEPPGLCEFLSSPPRFRAAASHMHRLSLVKVDGAQDQIQMHRVVQAVTRSQLRQNWREMFQAYRTAVDIMLAESNPDHPDQAGHDATYDLSLQHFVSERNFFNTSNPALRRLIIDQVRRLHLRGRHIEAMRFGQDALRVWRERLGRDHLQVLTMAVEVTIALRILGYAAEARELSRETLRLLKKTYGDEHEITLLCINTQGADLRSRAQFGEALELDMGLLPKFERIYGPDHERTLNVRNNLAADYRRLGRLREALETDQRTFEDRRRILGARDPRTLTSYAAVALDLRSLGLYQESLDIARQVARTFAAVGSGEHPDWLSARVGFAAALRKAGHHWDALQESEDVFQRYRDYLGADHTYTLRAGINLINDRRAVGDLVHSEELGREIYDRCRQVGSHFEFDYAALVSLASVLRVTGQVKEARRHDLQAREGLVETYGDLHPFTLAAGINYAADLAACGELTAAIRIGQDTLANCRAALGPDHPDTLMAAVNLAIDLTTSGNQAKASRLREDALSRYAKTLTTGHPEARAAQQGARLTAEIEPY